MKTQISVFPWANIGQNDHSNPYIESTTVLSDTLILIILDQDELYNVIIIISSAAGKISIELYYNSL